MPAPIYADLGWSGRSNRGLRTLRVVAVAGSIGALVGVFGALAVLNVAGDGSTERGSVLGGAAPHTRAFAAAPQRGRVSHQATDAGAVRADNGAVRSATVSTAEFAISGRPSIAVRAGGSTVASAQAAAPKSGQLYDRTDGVASPEGKARHFAVARTAHRRRAPRERPLFGDARGRTPGDEDGWRGASRWSYFGGERRGWDRGDWGD